MLAISASKRSFLFPSVAPVALTGVNGCTGAIVQRTGVEVPAASMKRNALRLLYALLSKPDDTLWLWLIFVACTNSGWLATNAAIFSGSGLCVFGSGCEAIKLS